MLNNKKKYDAPFIEANIISDCDVLEVSDLIILDGDWEEQNGLQN